MFRNRNTISQPQSLNTSFNNNLQCGQNNTNHQGTGQHQIEQHCPNLVLNNNKFHLKSQNKMKGLQSENLGDHVLQFQDKHLHNKLKARHKRFVTSDARGVLKCIDTNRESIQTNQFDGNYTDRVVSDLVKDSIRKKEVQDDSQPHKQNQNKQVETVKANLNFENKKRVKINTHIQGIQLAINQKSKYSTQQNQNSQMADITKTNLYANSTTQKRTEDKDSGEADRRKAGLTKGKQPNRLVYIQKQNNNILNMDELRLRFRQLEQKQKRTQIQQTKFTVNSQNNRQNEGKQSRNRLKQVRPPPLTIINHKLSINTVGDDPRINSNNAIQCHETIGKQVSKNRRGGDHRNHKRTISNYSNYSNQGNNSMQNSNAVSNEHNVTKAVSNSHENTLINQLGSFQQTYDEPNFIHYYTGCNSSNQILAELSEEYEEDSENNIEVRVGLAKPSDNCSKNNPKSDIGKQNRSQELVDRHMLKDRGVRIRHQKTSSLTITNIENINNELDLGLKIIDDSFEISVMDKDYCGIYGNLDADCWLSVGANGSQRVISKQKDRRPRLYMKTSTEFNKFRCNPRNDNRQYRVHVNADQVQQIILDESMISPQCQLLTNKLNKVLLNRQGLEHQNEDRFNYYYSLNNSFNMDNNRAIREKVQLNLCKRRQINKVKQGQMCSQPNTAGLPIRQHRQYNQIAKEQKGSRVGHGSVKLAKQQLIMIEDVGMLTHHVQYHISQNTGHDTQWMHGYLNTITNLGYHPNILSIYNYEHAQSLTQMQISVYKQPILLTHLYPHVVSFGELMGDGQSLDIGDAQINKIAKQLVSVVLYLYRKANSKISNYGISENSLIMGNKCTSSEEVKASQETKNGIDVNHPSKVNQRIAKCIDFVEQETKNYEGCLQLLCDMVKIEPDHIYLCQVSDTITHLPNSYSNDRYTIKVDLSQINHCEQTSNIHNQQGYRHDLNVNCNGNKLCETVMLNSIKSKIVSEGNAESGHSWIKKEKEKVTKINTSRTDKISSESGTNSHCHTANIRNKTNFMESQLKYKSISRQKQIEDTLAHNLRTIHRVLQYLLADQSVVNSQKQTLSMNTSWRNREDQKVRRIKRGNALCRNFMECLNQAVNKYQDQFRAITFCQLQCRERKIGRVQKVGIDKILIHPYICQNYQQLTQQYFHDIVNILY